MELKKSFEEKRKATDSQIKKREKKEITQNKSAKFFPITFFNLRICGFISETELHLALIKLPGIFFIMPKDLVLSENFLERERERERERLYPLGENHKKIFLK